RRQDPRPAFQAVGGRRLRRPHREGTALPPSLRGGLRRLRPTPRRHREDEGAWLQRGRRSQGPRRQLPAGVPRGLGRLTMPVGVSSTTERGTSRHVVARVEEIPVGARKIVQVGNRSIGVFNVGGEFYALK